MLSLASHPQMGRRDWAIYPQLISPSEAKLFGASSGITYDDLLPLALKLLDIPAIRRHLERRWAVIVSDEFQDTSHNQFELITPAQRTSPPSHSRRPQPVHLHQSAGRRRRRPGACCRRTSTARSPGDPPSRCLAPRFDQHSPRSGRRVRQRSFEHDAVKAALDSEMLEVGHHPDLSAEGALVSALVTELRDAGHESVGIFSRTSMRTASLSDH